MIAVAIVDDDPVVREPIRNFLNTQQNICCDIAAGSVEEFLQLLAINAAPNVVLMDIGLPGMSGISGIRLLKERNPDTDFLMLTIHTDAEKIFQSLCAGASGYLLKNTPFMAVKAAIEEVYAGGAPMSPEIARKVITRFRSIPPSLPNILTAKEKEVVTGLVDGLSYKMIAGRMNVSFETVKAHIKNIYRKLHTHSKSEVVVKHLRGEI